jgi:hypothetical protein
VPTARRERDVTLVTVMIAWWEAVVWGALWEARGTFRRRLPRLPAPMLRDQDDDARRSRQIKMQPKMNMPIS